MLTATLLYSFRHHRYTLDPRCSNFDKLRTLGRLMGKALLDELLLDVQVC